MKKLVLLSLIGISLVGCGEDKITKEYLVGDWRCNFTSYKQLDSGRDEGYGEPIRTIDLLRTFKLSNNKLYVSSGDDQFEYYDLDSLLNTSVYESTKDEYDFRTERHYKKINNDKYTYTIATEIREKNSTTNIINLREKSDIICTRIK